MKTFSLLLLIASAVRCFGASVSMAPAGPETPAPSFGRAPADPALPAGFSPALPALPAVGVVRTLDRNETVAVGSLSPVTAAAPALAALEPVAARRPALAAGLMSGFERGRSFLDRATRSLRAVVSPATDAPPRAELNAYYDHGASGKGEPAVVTDRPSVGRNRLASPAKTGGWAKAAAALPIVGAPRAIAVLAQAGSSAIHSSGVAIIMLSFAVLMFVIQAMIAHEARTDHSIYMDPDVNLASAGIFGGMTAITLGLAIFYPPALAGVIPLFSFLSIFAGMAVGGFAIPEDDVAAIAIPLVTFLCLTMPALSMMGVPMFS